MGEAKSKKTVPAPQAAKTPASSSTGTASSSRSLQEFTYGKKHIRIVLIGLALIALGLVLMSGGHMPSPEVWDESIIYSFRRTVLAPAFIIAGLAVQVYAIFKS
jgi:hypothetical protein